MAPTDTSSSVADPGERLVARFRQVRAMTEWLAEPLSPEDQTVQSMPDVSPTKWHRAHATWFFETFVLAEYAAGHRPVNEAFAYLFNSYYEAAGPRYPRPARGLLTRPGVAEVAAYRKHVDEAMVSLLESPVGTRPEVVALVELGLHHEQQHQELLLMDIKHVLSMNPMSPAYRPGPAPTDTAADPAGAGWIGFEGGVVEVGHDGDGFAFDNEGPRHPVIVPAFRLARRPVTAGEYMDFIADGGYERPELWLSDGWAEVTAEGRRAPLYWTDEAPDGEPSAWSVFTLEGRRPVHPDEPVCHVSQYEADAFARWAGARLPTEFEWEHAVVSSGAAVGQRAISLHPRPVGAPGDGGLPQAATTLADTGLLGLGSSVWEWTASAYLPYPGFAPAAGAVGEYNGKFMSGQMVLRGGAAITPAGHTRATYRNFFPAPARWAMSGIRLAESA